MFGGESRMLQYMYMVPLPNITAGTLLNYFHEAVLVPRLYFISLYHVMRLSRGEVLHCCRKLPIARYFSHMQVASPQA